MNTRFTKTALPQRYLYEYRVTGRGAFPVDMLRYDSCWPADGDSADVISAPMCRVGRDERTVRLRSYSEPTIGRWASFVWSVGR